MSERIASCTCGQVRIRARGKPAAVAICYCPDCQAGGRQLEARGAQADFRDPWGGTAYLVYGDRRLEWLAGAGLVEGFKLAPGAPTTRYLTNCCGSAMWLKFGPGWWTSLYRIRFGDAAPPPEMRNKTRYAQHAETLPRDLPLHPGFPPKLFWRLLKTRVGL